MHDLPTTPDDPTVADAGVIDSESSLPTRPVMPLVRLGAPVVGDFEPAAPPAVDTAAEPSVAEVAPADESSDSRHATDLLRRAALLRLVGLGRSRMIR